MVMTKRNIKLRRTGTTGHRHNVWQKMAPHHHKTLGKYPKQRRRGFVELAVKERKKKKRTIS